MLTSCPCNIFFSSKIWLIRSYDVPHKLDEIEHHRASATCHMFNPGAKSLAWLSGGNSTCASKARIGNNSRGSITPFSGLVAMVKRYPKRETNWISQFEPFVRIDGFGLDTYVSVAKHLSSQWNSGSFTLRKQTQKSTTLPTIIIEHHGFSQHNIPFTMDHHSHLLKQVAEWSQRSILAWPGTQPEWVWQREWSSRLLIQHHGNPQSRSVLNRQWETSMTS